MRVCRRLTAAVSTAVALVLYVSPIVALAQEQAAPEAPAVPVATAIGDLPRDLSPLGMFLSADTLVKAVLLGLVFASLVTWTVWLAKTIELVMAKRRLARGLKTLAAHRFLTDAAREVDRSNSPVGEFVAAANAELRLSSDFPDRDGIKERIASRLERIEAARARRILRGTGLLATIGATAPFVGLFGTVWGIMNSFIGISKSQTTNLAVVAPGIAEALLATAFGLAAAIPAVVIYNMFARQIAGYRASLGDASAEVLRLVGRELDRAALGPPPSNRRPMPLPAAE
jgi:biopolymer transport protein ExbB